jgi:hypothetical protein
MPGEQQVYAQIKTDWKACHIIKKMYAHQNS